jgi:FKBP-type peptidyl-prolyl cis-trans isomerase FkpA
MRTVIIIIIALVVTSFITEAQITENFSDFFTTNNGLKYKIVAHNNDSSKVELGDVFTLEMRYKIERADTFLFDSRKDTTPARLMLVKPLYKGDISEGLAMLASGDSARFVVKADSFYIRNVGLETVPVYVHPDSRLVFDIKIYSIQKKVDYENEMKIKNEKLQILIAERKLKEPGDFERYIKENKIYTQPTSSGLYFIETKKGKGAKAKTGKTALVVYIGKFLDGAIFDSNDINTPISFKLGAGEVIPGFEEGISMMRVGGKATLIMPSNLAYDVKGAGTDIMPYTPLIFEVELIKIKK